MKLFKRKSGQKIFTDFYEDKKFKEHKLYRSKFLKTEEDFLKCEFKSLKKTLAINKEIISMLIRKQENPKQVMIKLNEENLYLLNQIKLIKKQRDTYHRKSFLAEQVIAELRYKARDDLKDYRDTALNFLDELDCKEFVIQDLQYKYDKLEEILRKYARTDKELSGLLNEFDADRLKCKKKITSIIHENKKLKSELATVKQKVRELEERLKRGGDK